MSLIDYALTFLHQPYRWGGSNPLTGFDCSGLVLEFLQSVGANPFLDGSADALYRHYSKLIHTDSAPLPGALCFYGKNKDAITHVAFMVSHFQVIEAGSGDSSVTSLDAAKIKNAVVRIRPYNMRKDLQGIYFPDYPDWVVL